MSITRFYKIISPKTANVDITSNQDVGGNTGSFGNYTWYNRIVQGAADRVQKYREYDLMDSDIDVARALDIIAEEMCGNNPKTELPLQLHMTARNEQRIPTKDVTTLQAALKTWCKLQKWDIRMKELVRHLIKYGDVFFQRPKEKNKRWMYISCKRVVNAVVSQDDVTDVKGWHIKMDTKKAEGSMGTNVYQSVGGGMYDQNVDVFNADDIVRYSMQSEFSEEAPFGESVLRTVFKVFKQKELLEDSIIIYRIVRAPERRVFYIDVGKMPPHKVAAHLEQIKNEIKQRKIPTMQGGKNTIESIYNPTSTSEDYFFSVREGAANSRVETLAGGQNLGSMEDVQYFYQKIWRGLRVPGSYIINTNDEGGQPANDGAVGLAYIQEIKFSEYVESLQKHVESVMDLEFKRFLHEMKITIDPTIYQLVLPAPTNWSKSKQNKMDSELVNVYNAVKDDTSLSKRLIQELFLQWDQATILRNERMLREEKGLNPDGGLEDLPKLYFPEDAEANGYEGGLGGQGGDGDTGNFDGDIDEGDNTEEADTGENAGGNGLDKDGEPLSAGNDSET